MKTINNKIYSLNNRKNKTIFEQQKRLFERLESEKIAFKDLFQMKNLNDIIGLGFSNFDDGRYSLAVGVYVYRKLLFSINPYFKKLLELKKLQDGDDIPLNEKREPSYSIISDKKLDLKFHQIKELRFMSTKIKTITDKYITIVDYNQAPLSEQIVLNSTLVHPLYKKDYNLIQQYLKQD